MSETLSLEIKTPPAGADKPVTADPNRPAWLPEKFKTPEEMATAYSELEKKQGSTLPTVDLSTTDAAKAALTAQGFDFTKLSDEYTTNGKLTEESMAALKAKGFTEQHVNQFVEGQKAIARENTSSVFSAVGGEERFSKLMEFAPNAFSPAEVEAYNAAVKSGNYDTVKLMLAGLNTKFEKAFGKDAQLTTGRPPAQTVDKYENFQDYRNALKDPKYNIDSHYRQKVDEKLARSDFFKSRMSRSKGV